MGKYLNDRGFGIVRALEEVARGHHATATQVALAWLGSRPNITAPIASATSEKQLDEIAKAMDLKLDAASLDQLEKASA